MKRKFVAWITALALVFAMVPAMAFAEDSGGATATFVSFEDCTVIGDDEALEAPIFYKQVESDAAVINLVDLAGKMEDYGMINGVHSGYVPVEGTNIVDITKGYSITYEDFYEVYGDWLYQDKIKDLDFSNIYAMFIMDDDDNNYILVLQAGESTKTYDFKASINGTEITEITKEEGAYGYTNWTGTTSNVDLYTITVPEGTESVDFVVDNPVLAYNYGKNPCTDDDYLAGATPDYMTGNAEFSAKIDSNGDGKIDFIQVQTPYDSAYNSTLLYAVTFKYPEPAPEPAAKAPAAPKIKAQLTSNSKAKVTWGAVKGATSYKVSYKANGAKKWTTKTAKETNLTLTELKPGKTYQIKAAAVGAGGTSKDSNIAKAVTLAKVKGLKVRKNGVKYTMSWKKVSTAKGYQKKVYTSTTKKWNNIKKGKKLGATKFRTIRFFASKNYKYKVRAYKKVGNKMIYGPWSTPVKAK